MFLHNVTKVNCGGLFINGNNKNMYLVRCMWDSNYAGDFGAAIYVDSNNHRMSLLHSTFIRNTAAISGVVYFNSNNQNCHLSGFTFFKNSVQFDGGCIFIVSNNLNLTVQYSKFNDNRAGFVGRKHLLTSLLAYLIN
jgi:hypothetical protein